jgi:predicted amidophosphoribosyltransferase
MLSAGRVLPAPLKRATGAARSALRRMLDLALPPLCAACREPVEGRGLCPACWSKLSFITRPFCERDVSSSPRPLHWRRLWARRFNQSAMLAAAVSSQTGVPVASGALKRVKPTAQQVGLSRTERVANVQGAFRVPKDGKAAVTGRRLVLVDDVLTSGATVDGCARALLRAGAASVDVLVFARVAEPVRTSI